MPDSDTRRRLGLITSNTEEIIGREDLEAMLASGRRLSAYYGIATTGPMHIGYLIPLSKVFGLNDVGISVKILLADIHAVMDDQKSKFEELDAKAEYYRQCIERALPWKETPSLVRGSSFQLTTEYFRDLVNASSLTTVTRAVRAASEVTRMKDPKVSELLYPLMQALDEQYLDIDMQVGGLDQRHIMALSREIMEMLGYRKRVEIMTPLLLGLQGPGKKMSASIPESLIKLYEPEKSMVSKIKKAYCPFGVVESNPVLQISKFLVFGVGAKMDVKLTNGKDVSLGSYTELEALFVKKEIHPLDLKESVSKSLAGTLSEVREYFESNTDMLKRMGATYMP